MLANKGWKALFLGSGAYGADVLEFPLHPNIGVKRLPFCPAGWRQKLHYALFALWAFSWVLRWRPNWIYASDPISCPIAVMLSFVPGVRVLYHEHDSRNTKPQGLSSKFDYLVLKMRNEVARRADLFVLPNEQRVHLFKQQTRADRRVFHVW